MAEIHGVAGEWARVRGTFLGLWPIFLGVFASGFSVAVIIFSSIAVGASLLVLLLVALAWCYVKGMRRVERFYKGARGEERVAHILEGLPAVYHVFNDFVAGGKHIDHVVVGPAGIFAIETKFWRGTVTIEDGHVLVDGRLPSHSPLAQVLDEAVRLRGALAKLGWKGDVTPVLAFASDTFQQRVVEFGGAVVMNACELTGCFGTTSVRLAPDELVRIVTLMENNQR